MFLNTQSDIQKWSIFGNLSYDRDDDQLGTLIKISPFYGNIGDLNTTAIWDHNILGSVSENSQYLDGISIKSELSYGINNLDEKSSLTPFRGIDYSEISTRHYNIGT